MFWAKPVTAAAEKRIKKLDFLVFINDDHFKCPPQPHIVICRSWSFFFSLYLIGEIPFFGESSD